MVAPTPVAAAARAATEEDVMSEGPVTAERDAETAVAPVPSGHRPLIVHLPAEPESPSIARNLVGEACCLWDRAHLLHPARLVVSELVTNAVDHARSEITVVVSRHGDGLHLAVADAVPDLPVVLPLAPPRPDRPLDERGRGLRTVRATATEWGAAATPTGKVVWATLT
jgi:anti-sigma regulatory factor (Ser/Thr protein kinase)